MPTLFFGIASLSFGVLVFFFGMSCRSFGVPNLFFGMPCLRLGVPTLFFGMTRLSFGMLPFFFGVPSLSFGMPVFFFLRPSNLTLCLTYFEWQHHISLVMLPFYSKHNNSFLPTYFATNFGLLTVSKPIFSSLVTQTILKILLVNIPS